MVFSHDNSITMSNGQQLSVTSLTTRSSAIVVVLMTMTHCLSVCLSVYFYTRQALLPSVISSY